MKTGTTLMNSVSGEQLEAMIANKDFIYLGKSVLAKFKGFRLTDDEKREIFLDAAWYALRKHDPAKSSLKTFFVNNMRYTILTYLKKKVKREDRPSEITGMYLDAFAAKDEPQELDFADLLDSLDEDTRSVIEERFVDGLTGQQIGIMHGITKHQALELVKSTVRSVGTVYN